MRSTLGSGTVLKSPPRMVVGLSGGLAVRCFLASAFRKRPRALGVDGTYVEATSRSSPSQGMVAVESPPLRLGKESEKRMSARVLRAGVRWMKMPVPPLAAPLSLHERTARNPR